MATLKKTVLYFLIVLCFFTLFMGCANEAKSKHPVTDSLLTNGWTCRCEEDDEGRSGLCLCYNASVSNRYATAEKWRVGEESEIYYYDLQSGLTPTITPTQTYKTTLTPIPTQKPLRWPYSTEIVSQNCMNVGDTKLCEVITADGVVFQTLQQTGGVIHGMVDYPKTVEYPNGGSCTFLVVNGQITQVRCL